MAQAAQTYAYLRPSAVHHTAEGGTLGLQTSGGTTSAGRLVQRVAVDAAQPPPYCRFP
ncbi:hypothetical protein ACWY4P_17105 [Streptomyces sp. LZ34]